MTTAHNNKAQSQGAATTAAGATKAAQPKNPLHGFTLEQILNLLLAHYGGYPALARQVKLKCFSENPSLKSSLNFLRKTPWARTEVEQLFIRLGLYQHKP
ncbi:VF530 family protein [Rheinheimera sp. 4Y26]|nr:VF530 family protein [Rheinheimera sp. 4Y26]